MSFYYTPYYYNGYTPMQYYQTYQYPVMKGTMEMSPYDAVSEATASKIREQGPKIGLGILKFGLKTALRVGIMLATGGLINLPI